MDRGNKVFTDYTLDNRYVEFMMDNPEAMEWRMGHIHSHNTMETFFSPTDTSEIIDNSAAHNFYLSIITNNRLDFTGKLATRVKAEKEVPVVYKGLDENGQPYVVYTGKLAVSKEKVYTYPCEITVPAAKELKKSVFETNVDKLFAPKTLPITSVQTLPPNYLYEKYQPSPVVGAPAGKADMKAVANFLAPKSKKKGSFFPKMEEVSKSFSHYSELDWNNLENTYMNEDDIEMLAIALLNANPDNLVSNFQTFDEIATEVLNAIDAGMAIEQEYLLDIINRYPLVFNRFFNSDNSEEFVAKTDELIDFLEDSGFKGESLINKLIAALKHIVEQFNEYK